MDKVEEEAVVTLSRVTFWIVNAWTFESVINIVQLSSTYGEKERETTRLDSKKKKQEYNRVITSAVPPYLMLCQRGQRLRLKGVIRSSLYASLNVIIGTYLNPLLGLPTVDPMALINRNGSWFWFPGPGIHLKRA